MADLNERLKKANEAFSAQNYAEAAKLFEALTSEAPDNFKGQLALQQAISLYNAKDLNNALAAFITVLALNDEKLNEEASSGKLKCLEQLKRYPEALSVYEEALSSNPKSTQISWVNYANLCNEAKQYEKTLDVANKGLEHQPNEFSKLHIARIIAFFRLQNPLGALEDVEKVLAKKPINELLLPEKQVFSEVYLQHGQSIMAKGSNKEALKVFKKAHELHNTPQASFLMGMAYLNDKNEAEAMSHFRETLATDPKFWKANVALGLVLMRSGQSKYDEAVENFEQALNLSEEANNPNVHFNLGYAFYQLKRNEDAKKSLQFVYENEISNWRNSALLGTIYVEEKNWEKVIEYLTAAIEHSNGEADSALHYNLAYAYMMLQKYKEAKKGFEKALALDPSNQEAQRLVEAMDREIVKEEAEKERLRKEELARKAKEAEIARLKKEAEAARILAEKEKNEKIRLQKEEEARVKAEKAVEEAKEAEKQKKIKKQQAIERRRKRLEELRVLAGAPQKYRARRPSLDLIPVGNTNDNAHKYAKWYNEKIVKNS